jgi:hypothetical protein
VVAPRALASRAARLALCFGGLVACAETAGTGRGPSAGTRQTPDDSDGWNLVPAGAEAIADVDLAALRGSPWSSSLMTGDLGGERAARRQMFGFDVFTEADRMLVVSSGAGGTTRALTVIRGNFDAAAIGTAFTTATPGASVTRWRETPLWESAGRAVAVVTPRTLVQGDAETVRAAVDAAWGIVPDARAGELGELRRRLDAEPSRSALFVALAVTDAMRANSGSADVPPELRRLAGRVDLGDDLTVNAVAVFDNARAASAAAAAWTDAARQLARNPLVMVLGVSAELNAITLRGDGNRVVGALRIPASKRDLIGDRVRMILEALASKRGSG